MYKRRYLLVCCILLMSRLCEAQVSLSLKQAIDSGTARYESIRAKLQYVKAAEAQVEQARKDMLPNLVVSAQQVYGTVNGQNGPGYGLGGYGVSSSGLPLPEQNWRSAFGALYLANINWDVFTFGRNKQRISTANAQLSRDQADLQQELFQHQVRVTAAYLNLLAAQQLTRSQQFNLDRADTFRQVVVRKAVNGLVAGVDSSLANAEVSNARTALILARDAEQERANQLAFLIGSGETSFILDTVMVSRQPDITRAAGGSQHPVLAFYQRRADLGLSQAKLINASKFPALTVFGVIQTRGSGFSHLYINDQTQFSHNYFDGIKPTRSNYLLGMGFFWNLTSVLRVNQQVHAQQAITAAQQHEYQLAADQLNAQQQLAETKLINALANFNETPVQVKAATDAYLQKSVLYKNGLTTIIDVTQTLYTLNRAETNRDIAFNNVWQALLLKAAAAGDLGIFLNQLQ
ncbi:MAG: TolC family protein [Flavihumibacter sp.]